MRPTMQVATLEGTTSGSEPVGRRVAAAAHTERTSRTACPQHGTCDEETLIERMIHQWTLVQDAGAVAWKRAKATWASWWAIKAMLALLIAKLAMSLSTPTMPTVPLLPEPVCMLTLEGGYHKQAYVYCTQDRGRCSPRSTRGPIAAPSVRSS